MLDITKYLKKINIKIKKYTDETFIIDDNDVEKEINRKKLEQYLFICLTDYINNAK